MQKPQPLDTKQRILDAAEKLFARQGLHATSLRHITSEAKVNLASVNYHFGSKNALIEAVFERRLIPLNQERFVRLEQVREQAGRNGRRPAAPEVLRAFVEPTLRFRETSPGARHFLILVSRFFIEEEDTFRNMFLQHVGPVLQSVHALLCEALPELGPEVLLWRLHFVLGALGHVMLLNGQLSAQHQDLLPHADPGQCTTLLLSFLIAGMEAT